MDWLRHPYEDPPCFGYGFKSGQVLDDPLLRAQEKSKTGCSDIAKFQGHEVSWPLPTMLASITSCESGRVELGSASRYCSGAEVVIVDLPVLNDMNVFFKKDTEVYSRCWGYINGATEGLMLGVT